jgi:hypothetical protein
MYVCEVSTYTTYYCRLAFNIQWSIWAIEKLRLWNPYCHTRAKCHKNGAPQRNNKIMVPKLQQKKALSSRNRREKDRIGESQPFRERTLSV